MLCIAPSVCDVTHLSVCHGSLSQWLNVSPNFSLSGSHTVLVIPYQMLYQHSNGREFPYGGVECRRYEKS